MSNILGHPYTLVNEYPRLLFFSVVLISIIIFIIISLAIFHGNLNSDPSSGTGSTGSGSDYDSDFIEECNGLIFKRRFMTCKQKA